MTDTTNDTTNDPTTDPPRSYLDLSNDELQAIIDGDDPNFYDLQPLVERTDFASKIFIHRANPALIAKHLLRERHGDLKTKHRAERKQEREQRLENERIARQEFKTRREQEQSRRLANAEEERKVKREMIALRKLEAEAKLQRHESLTVFQERILAKLQAIEKGVDYLVSKQQG